jgi:hypothetical protein
MHVHMARGLQPPCSGVKERACTAAEPRKFGPCPQQQDQLVCTYCVEASSVPSGLKDAAIEDLGGGCLQVRSAKAS